MLLSSCQINIIYLFEQISRNLKFDWWYNQFELVWKVRIKLELVHAKEKSWNVMAENKIAGKINSLQVLLSTILCQA